MPDELDNGIQSKVQAAIDQHLAENGGGFVTGWHFIADFIDEDGDQSWLFATADKQRAMTTMGLLAWANGITAFEQQCYLEELRDD